jgi:hypothetical protein
MDIHRGLKGAVDDICATHLNDLEVQEEYGVQYLRWWVQSVAAHGVLPRGGAEPGGGHAGAPRGARRWAAADKIVEVAREVVEAFLGESVDAGLGWMTDPAGSSDGGFRSILFTDLGGSTSIRSSSGTPMRHGCSSCTTRSSCVRSRRGAAAW